MPINGSHTRGVAKFLTQYGKLNVLEGDRKAYFESAVHALSENKKRVAELRSENQKLRSMLKEGLASEDRIISHVFHNRQADKACLINKTGSEAITVMDYRTCDAMKKYNALRHMTVQKEEKIESLKKTYLELQQAIEDGNATTAGTNREGKRLRELENRLDKAQLKYQEAEHIKRTYGQIKDKLQDEQLTYGHSLDNLEKQIKMAQDELAELQVMYSDAVLSKDAAQKELKYQEEVIVTERRRREAELTGMKRIAEGKKSSGEKSGPFVIRDSITEDAQGGSAGGSAAHRAENGSLGAGGISEEQQQKITAFEDSFRQIKEATGLSDLNQIVRRFESQGETLKHLIELKDKAERQCQALREERDRLQSKFEELKYSGETELTSINQLLEQYKKEAETETQRREQLNQSLSEASRLLVQCKAGVDHIHEKLNFVSISSPYIEKTDTTDDQVPEMLRHCNERLSELMEGLKDVDIDEQLSIMEHEEFFSKLEGNMPDFNTRIKIPTTHRESAHDDDDVGGDENDILTRATLKKQSQQIVEMRNKKRQPRKKKRRSK
ncbi:coiled-coil domain-containing protein 151 [Clonorchis sinensis]|uniref:Coiled-coil domain-containing protein 151 n=1 Tax=Clonorchis sinensis TaxID=79923 RepID=G7Y2K4_CLOSI|nr:coiled-coil domain-containing protein 151 [Clonorchis sinensis]